MAATDWNKLINTDEAVLFARLGTQLAGLNLGGSEDRDRADVGKRWWLKNVDALRKIVCQSQSVKAYSKEIGWDRLSLCTAVFDLLLVHYNAAFSTTISALIMRQGLLEFCDDAWRDGAA